MKFGWKYGALLLCCTSYQALAAADVPTTDTLKAQFIEQYGGVLHLENATLRLLDEKGNQATWMAEGSIVATDDLYAIVGKAADYRFLEQTWAKDRPVKFSAMVTSVGTKASGWRTEFFSVQMAAKNTGYTGKDIDKNDKDLVITDSDFNARLGKIEASFVEKKATIAKLKKEQQTLKARSDELHNKINKSWGMDKNGNPLDRDALLKSLMKEMHEADRQNDPIIFEEEYAKTVFEPALAACQQKPDCDAEPLRRARDKAAAENRQKYAAQHKILSDQVQEKMDAADKKLEPLRVERHEVVNKIAGLEKSINELQRDYDCWQDEMGYLRQYGVIK